MRVYRRRGGRSKLRWRDNVRKDLGKKRGNERMPRTGGCGLKKLKPKPTDIEKRLDERGRKQNTSVSTSVFTFSKALMFFQKTLDRYSCCYFQLLITHD